MQGSMLLGKTMPKIRSPRSKSAISKDVTYSFTGAMMPYGNMQPRLHNDTLESVVAKTFLSSRRR
jgi:hypothetical protein